LPHHLFLDVGHDRSENLIGCLQGSLKGAAAWMRSVHFPGDDEFEELPKVAGVKRSTGYLDAIPGIIVSQLQKM
jgi:hypothetical protein